MICLFRAAPVLALALAAAGCGATKVVVSTSVETETVTRTFRTTVRQTLTLKQPSLTPASPEPTVYVRAMEGLLYKPDTISYYGGHQLVTHIRWTSYGGQEAIGNALYGRDDCNPSCAAGHYTYTPITVRLTSRELCRGVVAYTMWSLTGAGLDAPPAYVDETGPCRS